MPSIRWTDPRYLGWEVRTRQQSQPHPFGRQRVCLGLLQRATFAPRHQVGASARRMAHAYAIPVESSDAYVQPYAGFWLRFAAYLIDSIVLVVIQMVLAAAVILIDPGDLRAFLNVAPVGWALTWAYFAVLESSPLQGTVGKHALGLYVTDVYGDPIGLGRASARYWLKLLSTLLLMAGWIMAAFTPRKQALHDLMARTLVLRRLPPVTAVSAAEAANLDEYWDGRQWVSRAPLEAQP